MVTSAGEKEKAIRGKSYQYQARTLAGADALLDGRSWLPRIVVSEAH